MNKTFESIDEIYDLEIKRIISVIEKERAKKVLLQFPEGMKPYAQAIVDKIEGECNCEGFIWLGSCFGGCDIPLEVEKMGVDLIIQFGHSNWGYKNNVKELK